MKTNLSTMKRYRRCPLFAFIAGICFFSFTVATNAGEPKLLFDFSKVGPDKTWQVVNDDVMGGISASRFQITNKVAIFSGALSLENNGGFASVRSAPIKQDLAGTDHFVVRVRGDGRTYKFMSRTDPGFDGALYQAEFKTKSGEWTEHQLPMKDFVPTFRGRVLTDVPPLEASRVNSIGILIADKQTRPFRLEIESIGVLKGAKSQD